MNSQDYQELQYINEELANAERGTFTTVEARFVPELLMTKQITHWRDGQGNVDQILRIYIASTSEATPIVVQGTNLATGEAYQLTEHINVACLPTQVKADDRG